MLSYRASLDVSRDLAQTVAALLSAHRGRIGTAAVENPWAASLRRCCRCGSCASMRRSPTLPATTLSA